MTKLGHEAYELYCVASGCKETDLTRSWFMGEPLKVHTQWLNVAKHVRKQQRKAVKDAISKAYDCRHH